MSAPARHQARGERHRGDPRRGARDWDSGLPPGNQDRRSRRVLAVGLMYALLLVVPATATLLRYTTPYLNADGVQQSTMSVQGVRLFYWGQDRLVPLVSIIASPVSDPTLNLWLCLGMQAVAFYGLLLFIAHRSVAAMHLEGPTAVPLLYLVLVGSVSLVFSPAMLHSFAIEGQPYALSWLLAALSYEAWKSRARTLRTAGAVAGFLALGLNPSVVLLAFFLVVADVVRRRRIATWAGYVAIFVFSFVAWSWLSDRFAMYPTPEVSPSPSYLGFSLDLFQTGFADSIGAIVSEVRALGTTIGVLGALVALIVLPAPVRSRITLLGAFFAGFSVLYLALFAGNSWVMLNGYQYRYFFPVPLLMVMAMAIPVGTLLVHATHQLTSIAYRRWRPRWRWSARLSPAWCAVVLVGATALASFAGPLTPPQDTVVLAQSQRTADFAQSRGIHLIAGDYWNMWPLMHDMLDPGRDSVYVAGFKSAGDRDDYRAALDDQLAAGGPARALCVNSDVDDCKDYLDYWTRPGWDAGRGRCPAPPLFGPVTEATATGSVCRIMVFEASGS